MSYDLRLIDLNGEEHNFSDVDHVAFVNQESYGDGSNVAKIGQKDSVVVINTNAFAVAQVTTV